jgi:hypothetical protein
MMETENTISSLEELEENWQRVDSLVAIRDWVNGATLLVLVLLLRWSYRDLAWALWTNVIWTCAAVVAASVVMRLAGADRSGHPVGFWFGLVFGAAGAAFGAGILGALLSVFAASEPTALLGPNGYINANTVDVLRCTSWRYAPVLLLAANELVFSVGTSLKTHSPASARLGGYVGKMIGALVAGTVVGVALAGFFSPIVAEVGLGVFYLLWFVFPWRMLTKDAIQDQQTEGRPTLYAGRAFPLRFSERAGPALVIITSVLTLMFAGFGFTMLALGARQLATQGLVLGPALLVLLSLPVIGVFGFLALITFTLAGSSRRVVITAERVTVRERGWASSDQTSWRGRLAATFRYRSWQAALREYGQLTQQVEHHTSNDGPDYDEFTLLLKHRTEAQKDLVIYRAVHEQHIELLKQHYAQLLRVRAA